jgi:hypothetical protein
MLIAQLTKWPKLKANERAKPAKLASMPGLVMTKVATMAAKSPAVIPMRIISQLRNRLLYQAEDADVSMSVNIRLLNSDDLANALIVDRPLKDAEKCDMTGDLFVESSRFVLRAAAM